MYHAHRTIRRNTHEQVKTFLHTLKRVHLDWPEVDTDTAITIALDRLKWSPEVLDTLSAQLNRLEGVK